MSLGVDEGQSRGSMNEVWGSMSVRGQLGDREGGVWRIRKGA